MDNSLTASGMTPGTTPNQPGGNFNALHRLSVTGSPRMAPQAQRVKVASPPKKTAITCTFLWPVRGRIAR